MTQSHNEYDLSRLKPYLEAKTNAQNKELYSLCNAITASHKGAVRKTKSRILEALRKAESSDTQTKKIPKSNKKPDAETTGGDLSLPPLNKSFTTLDEATIETLILDLLNEEPTESRIKLAVDFHNKVKGTDVMRLEEALNMEGFLQYELSEREEEST